MLIENGNLETHQRVRSHPWSNTHSNVARLNWIAAGLLVFTCALLIWGLLRDKETVRSADNAHEVRLLAQQLLTTVTDAETGQRGFLITGDQTYLEPYSYAFLHLQEQVAALRRLAAAN